MGQVYLVIVNVIPAVCELVQSLQHRMKLLLHDCPAVGHSRVRRHALNVYECIHSRECRGEADASCELACPEKGVAVRYQEDLISTVSLRIYAAFTLTICYTCGSQGSETTGVQKIGAILGERL